jgi:hypothetical protein
MLMQVWMRLTPAPALGLSCPVQTQSSPRPCQASSHETPCKSPRRTCICIKLSYLLIHHNLLIPTHSSSFSPNSWFEFHCPPFNPCLFQSITLTAGQKSLQVPLKMHSTIIAQILALALLATPLVSGLPLAAPTDLDERFVTGNTLPASLAARHHTKAQITAKTKAGRDLTQDEIEEDEDDAIPSHLLLAERSGRDTVRKPR